MNLKYKKSSFSTAFFFLKKEQKEALSAVYEFSRMADDAADEEGEREEKIKKIEYLKEKTKEIYAGKNQNEEIFSTLSEIVKKYDIPEYVFSKLLSAMEKDINGVNIKDRAELEDYMFSVAGVIGIAVLKISEYKGKNLEEISVNTGNAVQMTNILRDIKEDLNLNRIYIPLNERMEFLKTDRIDFNSPGFEDLFRYEKNTAIDYYMKADEFFKKTKSPKLFVASVMKNTYKELLNGIDFDNVQKNHKISNYKKIKAVLKSLMEVF